jgi:hypothetical protein
MASQCCLRLASLEVIKTQINSKQLIDILKNQIVCASSVPVGQRKKAALVLFPRVGRSSLVAFPRVGRSSLVAFPRVGRPNNLVAFPRVGKSDFLLPALSFTRYLPNDGTVHEWS